MVFLPSSVNDVRVFIITGFVSAPILQSHHESDFKSRVIIAFTFISDCLILFSHILSLRTCQRISYEIVLDEVSAGMRMKSD